MSDKCAGINIEGRVIRERVRDSYCNGVPAWAAIQFERRERTVRKREQPTSDDRKPQPVQVTGLISNGRTQMAGFRTDVTGNGTLTNTSTGAQYVIADSVVVGTWISDSAPFRLHDTSAATMADDGQYLVRRHARDALSGR